jgi:glycosyltransferase 2 family protein
MVKRILRWLILGGTLFFLVKALKDNWQDIATVRIDAVSWAILSVATGITLLAHTWAGWIWAWVLQELNQPIHSSKFVRVYLKTNIAKYIPGNVWHYYGRILAAKNANIPMEIATLSVLLELPLMAAAALIIFLLNSQFLLGSSAVYLQIIQLFCLLGVLCGLHPKFLNFGLVIVQRLKTKKSDPVSSPPFTLSHYPLRPLLGELGFVFLRAFGFVVTLFALSPLNWNHLPLLVGAFSFSWLLGFIVPGAPGGLGVFEATAIALLQSHFPSVLVITAVGLYRLISIFAETAGASLAWLDEHFTNNP